MKTITALLALCLVSPFASAGGATLCAVYEFAELQTFTGSELVEKFSDYMRKAQAAPAGSLEFVGCMEQADRVLRIQKLRKEAAAAAKK